MRTLQEIHDRIAGLQAERKQLYKVIDTKGDPRVDTFDSTEVALARGRVQTIDVRISELHWLLTAPGVPETSKMDWLERMLDVSQKVIEDGITARQKEYTARCHRQDFLQLVQIEAQRVDRMLGRTVAMAVVAKAQRWSDDLWAALPDQLERMARMFVMYEYFHDVRYPDVNPRPAWLPVEPIDWSTVESAND